MSKVTLNKCDVCDYIVNHLTQVWANGCVFDLCDNCYKDISALEDMKHLHNVAINEINKKVKVMKNEREEDII